MGKVGYSASVIREGDSDNCNENQRVMVQLTAKITGNANPALLFSLCISLLVENPHVFKYADMLERITLSRQSDRSLTLSWKFYENGVDGNIFIEIAKGMKIILCSCGVFSVQPFGYKTKGLEILNKLHLDFVPPDPIRWLDGNLEPKAVKNSLETQDLAAISDEDDWWYFYRSPDFSPAFRLVAPLKLFE
jgi:hypothetical protein